LQAAVETGIFREDLFSLIHVVSLRLLPLRDRKADIPKLCKHLLQKLARQFGRSAPWLDPEVLNLLMQWDWPGNLRELENWIVRAIVFGNTKTLETELKRRLGLRDCGNSLPSQIVTLKKASHRALPSPSRDVILKVLQVNRWNPRKAAVHLDMSYRSLLCGMRDLGIPIRRRRQRRLPPRGLR
jgi:transcriptional regulator with PAS, ATPase and Fis domain